jgi:sugar phosphate isomerase/epimerase
MSAKFSAVAVVFGATADRYVLQGYTPQRSLEEMLDDAAKVEGLRGIELVGGWHVNDANQEQVVKAIASRGFEISMLIPELWADGKWGWGTLTSPDPGIRAAAKDRIRVAMDLAARVGCNQVSPWFGHDGYDYILQANYIRAWDLLVEGVRECAGHNPKVRLAIEYKVKEPRTHAFIGSTAKALLLVQEVGLPNVGVNLDVGHALLGYESMAESVALLKRFGDRLFHLHLNDNYRSWDDDMIPGSVHTLEWIEFFHWLARTGYNGWLSLDVFAYRERDKVAVGRESLAWLTALMGAAERLDRDGADAAMASGDAMQATKLLREALLGKVGKA